MNFGSLRNSLHLGGKRVAQEIVDVMVDPEAAPSSLDMSAFSISPSDERVATSGWRLEMKGKLVLNMAKDPRLRCDIVMAMVEWGTRLESSREQRKDALSRG